MDHAFEFEFPRWGHVHFAVQQASALACVGFATASCTRDPRAAVSRPTSFPESLKNIKQNTAKIEAKF